jgi:NADPH2:quinone reductase
LTRNFLFPLPISFHLLPTSTYTSQLTRTISYFRTGLYPAPKPEILGREAEGKIVATGPGNVYNLKVGDYVAWLGTSSYAEYTACPADKAILVPSGVKPGLASASLLQGLTALTLIREACPVQKGEWVLVHAAAGGVGLWLCQLLKAVGARVIGTASTPAKIELAKANGAEFMINYSHENVVDKVNEITNGQGVPAVFDSVGASTFEDSMKIVARKGTMVSFGNASGAVPPFPIARLSAKNVKILRPTLFNYIYTREEYEKYAKELFGFIADGKVNVKVHETYPLQEVARAHTDLEGRKTTGKLMMKP